MNKKTIGIIVLIVGVSALVMPSIFNLFSEKVIRESVDRQAPVTFVDVLESIDVVYAQEDTGEYDELESGELQFLREVIKKSKDLAKIPSSRELTKSESKRLDKLNQKYLYEGVRPEEALSYENRDGFYFDESLIMICFPENEMTDEQILRFIDFIAKLNYIYKQNANVRNVDYDQNITKDQAERIAEEFTEGFYNIKLSEMNCYSELLPAKNTYKWSVVYEPKYVYTLDEQEKPYWLYFIDLDADSGNILYVDSYYSYREKESKTVNKLTLEEKEQFINAARDVLTRINIKDGLKEEVIYIPNVDGQSICTFFKSTNDEFYGIELSYPDKKLISYRYCEDEKTMRETVDKYAKIVLLGQ